jgi:FMN phosphatase YigB (HAD superfamily)
MISLNNLFEEEKPKINYTIFCDMDGVLCDFESRFEHFTGLSPDQYREKAKREYGEKKVDERFWDIIDHQIGLRFWRGMPWMSEGKELWNYIKPYKPTLLTAPSWHNSSKEGKQLWVDDHTPGTPIIFKQADKKSDLSGPNKILIDDREDTIMNWKHKNGIGILYTSTEQAINELKQLGI